MKELPGAETGLRAGIGFPPSMQNTVSMRCRMYGCQRSERIFFHSFGLLSPRSVIAIARIVGGMATDSKREKGFVARCSYLISGNGLVPAFAGMTGEESGK